MSKDNEKNIAELKKITEFIIKKQPHKIDKGLFFLKKLSENRSKDVGSVVSSNKMIQEMQQNLIPLDKILTQLMRKIGQEEATEVMKAFSTMSHEVNEKIEKFIQFAIEKNMIDHRTKERFEKKKVSKK